MSHLNKSKNYLSIKCALYIIYLNIYLISAKLEYQLEEIQINRAKTIILNSTELYVYTKVIDSGYLGHRIILTHSIGSIKDKIFFVSTNSPEIKDDYEYTKVKSETEEKNSLKQDIGPFEVKENKYAILKFIDLKNGEKIKIEAFYISKGFAIGIIIGIVIAALFLSVFIAWLIKKYCIKKRTIS